MKKDVKRSSDSREKEALEWATQRLRNEAREFRLKGNGGKETYNKLLSETLDDCLSFIWPSAVRNYPEQKEEKEEDIRSNLEKWADIDARAMRNFVAERVERGDELPPSMRKFVADLLRDPRQIAKPAKRGRKACDLLWRDHVIMTYMQSIVEGIPATRHPRYFEKSGHVSAASIIKEALETGAKVHLSEKRINNLWDSAFGRHFRRPFPRGRSTDRYWRLPRH